MSGFWPSSFTTIQDLNGKPIVGAKAYFYAAGTTTPITVYRDYGLTTAHPNPLETDGYGRFPAVFLDEADEFYRVRVTTPGGSILYDSDTLPIIGPTEGGGSPPAPVDPNSLLETGDIKVRYGEGFLDGYVRGNGRSIGTATSGATERANSDCQTLYEFLWNADPNLVVAGGRGASANADWSANKPIDLPDFRGRAIVGLDDMGNIAAGVLTDADDLGWKGGAQTHTLSISEMPVHNHDATSDSKAPILNGFTDIAGAQTGGGGSRVALSGGGTDVPTVAHNHAITVQNKGGGAAHNNIQPSLALTVYIRL
ncbi:hypothetical protein N181_25255 [Sinorhizobium fredii USDA 205]|uniref:Phage tail collar domain-containing protein n=2 Tax=Sinorhizobium TaxID=28105 RepID=A0A844AFV9_RHIFR|nr:MULTISPECIES: hypothetical protein [Sinorhizobium]KSV83686.1 hypothetical protein N181_25255 [Sinorhizobium fredii USDA 205]MQX10735.1 hypothetical protein [Sinorhizobium fredii]OAP40355.1 hypothetical protein AU381_00050 [Sinorhizobium glycinis]GEC33563.1 hypothetical protein EFR01_37340 [Sinorhizobium fredii]GLS11864.1 hypothetical protein GCM10007864_54960 [Sinorhizobium fredii]